MPIEGFVTRSIHDAPDIERLHEYVYATIQTAREKYGIDNVNKIILGSNCYRKLLDSNPLAFVSVYECADLESGWISKLYGVPYIVDKECTWVHDECEFLIKVYGFNYHANAVYATDRKDKPLVRFNYNREVTLEGVGYIDLKKILINPECEQKDEDISENDFLAVLNAAQTTAKENTI